jgi:hypothetical protein
MTSEYTGALKLLYDWQTLVAGLSAVIAGWMALHAAKRQIASSEKLRDAEISSRKEALLKKIIAAMTELNVQLARMAAIQDGVLVPKPELDAPWRDAIFDEIGILDMRIVSLYLGLYGMLGDYKKDVGRNVVSGGLASELRMIGETAAKVSDACKAAAVSVGILPGKSK